MSPPNVSPVTGLPVPSYYIHASTPSFQDTKGRTLLLRGINLASSAKTPVGQDNDQLEGFWEGGETGQMSFVGRVLSLTDGRTDEHLQRLKGWGFNVLRYIITWESIEHEAPGVYDQEYISYTINLLRKCKEYGFKIYLDPHQDLFSRFSGGSGAPYWTLLACGLDPRSFTTTGAAYLECEWSSPSSKSEFPAMIWASNYSRLACQTLFTLWSAGKDLAPKCIINDKNIQDFLQSHYFNAIKELTKSIQREGDLLDQCVLGWDSLNEPNAGFLGIENLNQFGKETILKIGPMPTPFQGMLLGMGNKVEVEQWKFGGLGPKRDGKILIDPKGVRAWMREDAEVGGSKYGWIRGEEWKLGTCIWALHDVWDPKTFTLLIPDYFNWYRGELGELPRVVNFGQDYWLEHWKIWAKVVREHHPEAIHFIQTPVFQIPPLFEVESLGGSRVVHSSHFYDGLTLITKHWNWFNADALGILRGKYLSVVLGVKIGEKAIRKCMRDQLSVLRSDTFSSIGQFPTMMSEIGIPFDLDGKKAYLDGNYSAQTKALDASLSACDGDDALNYSIWTYDPENCHLKGDNWNGEDLSLWSGDDRAKFNKNENNSLLDLSGKISRTRSRASSKAGSMSGSPFLTPSSSSARLDMMVNPSGTTLLNPSLASLASIAPTLILPAISVTPPPFKNLNDGARAIAAFCRPYPTKTIGVPINVEFDIRSSHFTLEVRVSADDLVPNAEEGEEELATEIYIPFVHYALDPSLISTEFATASSSSSDLTPYSDESTVATNSLPDQSATLISLPSTSSTTPSDLRDPDPSLLSLSVNVKISTGRYEIKDQTLFWYYLRPTIGKSDIIVKLELERQGGAIPAWVHTLGDTTNNRSIFEIAAALCPPDCVIM